MNGLVLDVLGTMKVLVLFATREGHTHKIARHVAQRLEKDGRIVDLRNVKELTDMFDLQRYDAAILAASVHVGQHEKEMVSFVRSNRTQLQAMPAAFLSVSLGAALEDQQAHDDVEEALRLFYEQTGWKPERVSPVGGALLYTQYGWFVRLMTKQIAKKRGAPTDTQQDHEFTDWAALDAFVDAFIRREPVAQ